MIEVRETDTYADWFKKLKDMQARARILARIRRVALGNLGDVEPVGDAVSELRIHYGPGYRIYILCDGPVLVILLGGGTKGTQKSDIAAAKALAEEIRASDKAAKSADKKAKTDDQKPVEAAKKKYKDKLEE